MKGELGEFTAGFWHESFMLGLSGAFGPLDSDGLKATLLPVPMTTQVMSPHFQTRFFVRDGEALLRVPGVTEEHVTSYMRMVQKLTADMAHDYGVAGGASPAPRE